MMRLARALAALGAIAAAAPALAADGAAPDVLARVRDRVHLESRSVALPAEGPARGTLGLARLELALPLDARSPGRLRIRPGLRLDWLSEPQAHVREVTPRPTLGLELRF